MGFYKAAREEKITIDVSFYLSFTDVSPDSLPRVVFVLRKPGGEHIHYWAFVPKLADGSPPPTGKMSLIRFKKGIDFRRDRVPDGAELKVYFWNINRKKVIVKGLRTRLSGFYREGEKG